MNTKIKTTLKFLKNRIKVKPVTGIVLGSGLGELFMAFDVKKKIAYSQIPHFKATSISGHKGELIHAAYRKRNLLILRGRYHYYEGHPMNDLIYPIEVLINLGIKKLIITNAAGSVNPKIKPADIMLITDHINLLPENPLKGRRGGKKIFVDMSEPYNKKLIKKVKEVAKKMKITVKTGVYCALQGPTYETVAESRFLNKIGADAVGMSTVPETIIARFYGIPVIGISMITNFTAGFTKSPSSHSEVLKIAKKITKKLTKLLPKII